MSDTVIKQNEFDAENVRFNSAKVTKTGGKTVTMVSKKNGRGFSLTTPLMMTWGASEATNPETGEGKGVYDMALQFPPVDGDEDDSDCALFYREMTKLEEKIKQEALVKSAEWFGKEHKSPEVIDALYTPILRRPKKDPQNPPTLRVKIPQWEGVWKVLLCDEERNIIFPNAKTPTITPLDIIQRGANIIAVIQCGGIWIINGKFGVTWKLTQAVVQRPKPSLLEVCVIDIKPSDKEKMKSSPASPNPAEDEEEESFCLRTEPVKPKFEEDTDDECENEEVTAQPEVPAEQEPEEDTVVVEETPKEETLTPAEPVEPVEKKKVVRKKKV